MEPMTPADVVAASGGDPLIQWAAQGLRPGVRAWVRAGAVAVACPELSGRDRLAVHGEPDAVATLLGAVLPEVGPSFRPLGDEALIEAVAQRVPQLEAAGRFGWLDVTRPVPATGLGDPHWLAGDSGVAELLEDAFPESYAWPGGSGVRRWAGITQERLVAVAADAWSVPEIGFLAGVATHPEARGRGLAASVCAFVTNDLLAGRQRVALVADYWNSAALATYRRLGFTLRPLAAARRRRR
jgi:GNAT superfamily N-acetyltransferase